MTKLTVKSADFEEIAETHNKIPEFNQESQAFFTDRCADNSYLLLIAKIDKETAGYAICYDRYTDGSFYIWMAGVLPKFRKKSVCSALYKHIELWSLENNYQSLRITTRNNRREMLYWLVKNGFNFIEIGQRKPITDNRIYLVKNLKTS